MTHMSARLESLTAALTDVLAKQIANLSLAAREITIEIPADSLLAVAALLRDDARLSFDQLTDLCGVDYSLYGNETWTRPRFAVVYHLLSYQHNCRLRVRTFATNDDLPLLDSVVDIWPAANWYEREAFDLFGIVFSGHPDLRRILTDYGFIGHPFRKDFPQIGKVEMRYDPDQHRVIYEAVSIEPRSLSTRIIREDGYGG